MRLRLSLKKLSYFSRQIATMLEAGLPIRRCLTVLDRNARGEYHKMLQRMGGEIEQGSTLTQALENEGRAFPKTYTRLVHVGESSGGLDDVFKSLADYYDFLREMRRMLIRHLAYPAIEFVMLIGVLAAIPLVLAIVANREGGEMEALRILAAGAAIGVAPFILYYVTTRGLGAAHAVHMFLNRVPVLGNIIRTLALARFCWTMQIMTNAGVRIYDAITWSLEATANGEFVAAGRGICDDLRNGAKLHEAFENSRLFPTDVIEMVQVGEESGTMPDLFARLSRQYMEKAQLTLRVLAQLTGWLVWLGVAGVIVYYIFKFAMQYMQAMSSLGL